MGLSRRAPTRRGDARKWRGKGRSLLVPPTWPTSVSHRSELLETREQGSLGNAVSKDIQKRKYFGNFWCLSVWPNLYPNRPVCVKTQRYSSIFKDTGSRGQFHLVLNRLWCILRGRHPLRWPLPLRVLTLGSSFFPECVVLLVTHY